MSERKRLSELVALYLLEPSIRDIYVEGGSDQRFIEWLLRELDIKGVAAYEIDSVDVPPELLNGLSVENGNRGRVVALAHCLHATSKVDLVRRVACLVDRDFDHLLGIEFECPLLILTDYCAAELYCLDQRVIEKFLTLVVGKFPMNAAQVIAAMVPVLRELFLVRLANATLRMGLKNLSFDRCCSISREGIVFDQEQFVARYLGKSGKRKEVAAFTSKMEELRAALGPEARLSIHGHDFVDLLHLLISKIKRRSYDLGLLRKSLFACLERRHVEDSQVVMSLVERFAERVA